MLSKIWVNTDVCDEHYKCATALYNISMLPQSLSIFIDSGVSEQGHGK